jgi:hypothetical protein
MVKAVCLGYFSPVAILCLLMSSPLIVFELDCGMLELNRPLNVLSQVSLWIIVAISFSMGKDGPLLVAPLTLRS